MSEREREEGETAKICVDIHNSKTYTRFERTPTAVGRSPDSKFELKESDLEPYHHSIIS